MIDKPMTSEETADTEDTESDCAFFIDLAWLKERGRSFDLMVQTRMCEECRGKLGTEYEVREPVTNKKGKVVFEEKRVTFGSNPLKVIRDCCGKRRDYILPDQPLLEAIFRIFLANANQPLGCDDIRDHLVEWLGTSAGARDISPRRLRRILDSDSFYGLRRVPEGARP